MKEFIAGIFFAISGILILVLGYNRILYRLSNFIGITKKRIQKTNFIKHLRISTAWLLRISEKVVYKL